MNQPAKIPVRQFRSVVLDYYAQHCRILPWRQPEPDGSFDPYKILVSEIMLQQTQVVRVIPKYQSFIDQFPTIDSLAAAPLAKVLELWSGLGYNRRGLFLHRAAQALSVMPAFPQTVSDLSALPGIGKHTAGAIVAYAFDQPVVFIETNIRTVFIHHYFPEASVSGLKITDKQLEPIIQAALPASSTREWYWALMDYGSYLKTRVGNLAQVSRHYTKQSTFAGSKRQLRGKVIKLLLTGPQTLQSIEKALKDDRTRTVLVELEKEHLITLQGEVYSLA